jgi:hypothetical protein
MKISTNDAPELLMDVLKVGLVPMLVGSPGVGKSTIIRDLAEKKKLKVIDLRLSQCDPSDLLGFPVVNQERTKSGYVPMVTFPVEGDEIPAGYRGWLLLLDEFNSASRNVQAAAYKIVLDKQVGDHKLHPRVAIVAAGNLTTDRAIVNPMSTAMQSRLIHYELSMNHKDWTAWAHQAQIDHRVISYINFKPDMLHKFDAHHDDATFPCPRTWEFVSKIIHSWDSISTTKLPAVAGAIGEGAAREFVMFVDIFKSLPTIGAILANPTGLPVPEEASVQFAISGMITNNVNKQNIDKLVTFVRRMPIEFFVITIQDILNRNRALIETPAIQKCMVDLSKELA